MSQNPPELYYAKTHEWVRREEDGTVTVGITEHAQDCLLYTSPSPRDRQKSRMPSSA